jgi:hypothetical protein
MVATTAEILVELKVALKAELKADWRVEMSAVGLDNLRDGLMAEWKAVSLAGTMVSM